MSSREDEAAHCVDFIRRAGVARGGVLNAGICSRESAFRDVAQPPTASSLDEEIVDAISVQRGNSLERLLLDELSAIGDLLHTWSELTSADMRSLFFRNSICKRALYVSTPIFLPDNLPSDEYVRRGCNTRVHIYRAAKPERSIRLEAVSSHRAGRFRFRYALSIQYVPDFLGRYWQLLRPVVLLDDWVLRWLMESVPEPYGSDTGWSNRPLPPVLAALRKLVLLGNHDYVHGTLLNWFPPVELRAPPEYLAVMSERCHPQELDNWHAESGAPWPPGFADPVFRRDVVPLELFSLITHADIVGKIRREKPQLFEDVWSTVDHFFTQLDGAVGRAPRALAHELDRYLATIASWFLAGAFPVGTEELSSIFSRPDRWGRPRLDVLTRLARFHGGCFSWVNRTSRSEFPWGGELIDVHDVARRYDRALRKTALQAHLDFFVGSERAGSCGLLPRDGAGAMLGQRLRRSWVDGVERADVSPDLTLSELSRWLTQAPGLAGVAREYGYEHLCSLRRLRDNPGYALPREP